MTDTGQCIETLSVTLIFFVLSAWLSGYENPVVSRINMRIQDLTGLDVSTAEELQVGCHIILNLSLHSFKRCFR